jgi:hypothetical protein
MKKQIKNIVCISDTHFGSTLALCPPKVALDDGGYYQPSKLQKILFAYWRDFWRWVDEKLNGEKFILIHNGDMLDGKHHNTTTLISQNLKDQENLAVEMMQPVVNKAFAYYQIRGTEAHAGTSAEYEERVAQRLCAVKDEATKQHSRWELWMELGDDLIHFSHHLGVTSSSAYEASAPMREITAAFVEAGQWGMRPPTILIRSHRHRYIEVKPPNGRLVVTPGWQGKTPFVFRIDRMRAPMFGGIIIKLGEEGIHVREKLYTIQRPQTVVVA